MDEKNNIQKQIVEHVHTNQYMPLDYMRSRPNTLLLIIIGLLIGVIVLGVFGWKKHRLLEKIKIERVETILKPITDIEGRIDSLETVKVVTRKSIDREQARLDKLEKELNEGNRDEMSLQEAIKLLEDI